MKLFVKLMALILVLAIAGPFFMKGPDGQPLMTIDNVTTSVQRQWHKLVSDTGRMAGNDDVGKVEVHRWQDADGNWHFSDEKNPHGASEIIKVDPYASRMDPFKPNKIPESTDTPAATTRDFPVPLPLTVTPGEAKKLVEDTVKVREDMEKRAEEIEKKSR